MVFDSDSVFTTSFAGGSALSNFEMDFLNFPNANVENIAVLVPATTNQSYRRKILLNNIIPYSSAKVYSLNLTIKNRTLNGIVFNSGNIFVQIVNTTTNTNNTRSINTFLLNSLISSSGSSTSLTFNINDTSNPIGLNDYPLSNDIVVFLSIGLNMSLAGAAGSAGTDTLVISPLTVSYLW